MPAVLQALCAGAAGGSSAAGSEGGFATAAAGSVGGSAAGTAASSAAAGVGICVAAFHACFMSLRLVVQAFGDGDGLVTAERGLDLADSWVSTHLNN